MRNFQAVNRFVSYASFFLCIYLCIHLGCAQDMLEIQNSLRIGSGASHYPDSGENRRLEVSGDDDHVFSSEPTMNTYAPTPSGTTSYSSTCLSGCSGYSSTDWNLDDWCAFYWDADCYLPDTNFLNINPAGKLLVSDYGCVPSCLNSSACGATYCRTFAHLYSSCSTGYAHLLFNSSLQDTVHKECMLNFLNYTYMEYYGSEYDGTNSTEYSWRAGYTLTSVTADTIANDSIAAYKAIKSATAYVMSGVIYDSVEVVSVADISIRAPTMAPTYVTPFPTIYPTGVPSLRPSSLPTATPTTNTYVYCDLPVEGMWCNNNQHKNILLGDATTAEECQQLCDTYVGANFDDTGSGCCLWYVGNTEPTTEHDYLDCSLQPDGSDTSWADSSMFWGSLCTNVSPFPTVAPTASSGNTPEPSPEPTPIPTMAPSVNPTSVPTATPTQGLPTPEPTMAPTYEAIGVRVIVEINATTESLGLPRMSSTAAYLQISTELKNSFTDDAFKDALELASISFESNATLGLIPGDISTELDGYDNIPTLAPTAGPGSTSAPTPTLYFEPTNSTATDDAVADSTAVIAGSTAAVVGSAAAGTAVYSYSSATSDFVQVAPDPMDGIDALSV